MFYYHLVTYQNYSFQDKNKPTEQNLPLSTWYEIYNNSKPETSTNQFKPSTSTEHLASITLSSSTRTNPPTQSTTKSTTLTDKTATTTLAPEENDNNNFSSLGKIDFSVIVDKEEAIEIDPLKADVIDESENEIEDDKFR